MLLLSLKINDEFLNMQQVMKLLVMIKLPMSEQSRIIEELTEHQKYNLIFCSKIHINMLITSLSTCKNLGVIDVIIYSLKHFVFGEEVYLNIKERILHIKEIQKYRKDHQGKYPNYGLISHIKEFYTGIPFKYKYNYEPKPVDNLTMIFENYSMKYSLVLSESSASPFSSIRGSRHIKKTFNSSKIVPANIPTRKRSLHIINSDVAWNNQSIRDSDPKKLRQTHSLFSLDTSPPNDKINLNNQKSSIQVINGF